MDLYVREAVVNAISDALRDKLGEPGIPRYTVVADTSDGCVVVTEGGVAYEVSVRKL